jgi:hypothetical protein
MEQRLAAATTLVKNYLGLLGCVSVVLIYWLNDDLAKHFFPKLKVDPDEWDKAYFLTQCIYAFIIGVIASVFAKGKPTRQEVFIMTILTGMASGDITDRLWKVLYDPNLDLTKTTQADVILLIISIYYARKKYVSTAHKNS